MRERERKRWVCISYYPISKCYVLNYFYGVVKSIFELFHIVRCLIHDCLSPNILSSAFPITFTVFHFSQSFESCHHPLLSSSLLLFFLVDTGRTRVSESIVLIKLLLRYSHLKEFHNLLQRVSWLVNIKGYVWNDLLSIVYLPKWCKYWATHFRLQPKYQH